MNKSFGYRFWKDAAETAGYAMIALGLISYDSTKMFGLIGFFVIMFYFFMMTIEEYKS